ncbi:MAG: hypothetical protein ACR2JJ_04370 [Sphingomicrobium sp.]
MSLKAIAEEALARLKSGETGHETKKETEMKHMKQDLRRKTAGKGACFTVSFPKDETCETSLPEHVAAGLARLRSVPVPRRVSPAAWVEVVADDVRLEREGWVTTALAFGWTDLDLFGAVADADGDPDADGLSVKLNGRRVLAICESFATVADEGGGRSYLYRGDTSSTRLLWSMADG